VAVTLENLYPLIVPRNYYSPGTWDLPHHNLAITELILTWVSFQGNESMYYLTYDEYQYLNETQPNWQQQSFENLRYLTSEDEYFCTHFLKSEHSKNLVYVAFMNHDGIGSSRILLSEELRKVFPNGYFIAIPDRSCGFAIDKNASADELSEIRSLIKNMFEEATTPMSPTLYDVSDFKVINNWTIPINQDYANNLIKNLNTLC